MSCDKDEVEAANASFAALSSPTDCRWKSPMELDEGSEKRMCFNAYESKFSLCILEFGTEEAIGGKKSDKKTSFDAAAISMLSQLQKQGLLNIGS